jgi:phage terminase large subunit
MYESILRNVRAIDINAELFKRRKFDFITRSKRGFHAKQEEALQFLTDRKKKIITYGGAAGGAKSWTGASWLMFMCINYPGTRWFVGRNELKRLRQSTLPTFDKQAKVYGAKKGVEYRFHGTDNCILFKNGSRIDFLDLRYLPGDPLYERFGSIEYTGGWIEEAGEVDFRAFDVLKTRIGRHLNEDYDIVKKLFITLNPKKNWCYNRIYLPFKNGKLPKNEIFIQCLVDENPFIDSGYIEGLDEIEDKQLRERLRYGNWEYEDDANALVSYDALCDLFLNNHIRPDVDNRYLVADIALEGSDLFVIGIWFGDVLVDIMKIPKSDGKKVYLTIDQLKVKYKIPNSNICYDADGVGGFIAGFVKNAVAFHNGAPALNKEDYENVKTQLYYKLAKEIQARNIWIACDVEPVEEEYIKTELSAQLKSGTADDDRKLKIVKKSEVKKDIGRSPDIADMLMMRMYWKINKTPRKAPRTIRVIS